MTTANRSQRWRVAALLATVAALLLGGVGLTLPTGAAPPAPTPTARPALDWLAAQLTANGGTVPGSSPGTTDWGVTADAILAFAAAGRTTDVAAQAATDLLDQHSPTYTTWDDEGTTIREAGPTAKALLTLLSMDRSAVSQGVDLDAALRGLMKTSGVQAGRFSDGGIPDPTWDTSNGFGQALALLALAMTPGGMPSQAVSFQLAQQCPAGGFRLNYGTTAGCTADSQADADISAMAVMALLAAEPRTAQVTTALEKGVGWLIGRQADDGSFGGAGPTAAANTNSAGLVAQALRAAGASRQADAGAAWISTCCQLTAANAAGTPAAGDLGAMAYSPAALAAARTSGITNQTGEQWRRSTAQAVLAFGLAPYGPQDVEPLAPESTTTTTSTTTSTTTTSTTTSTTTTSTTTTTTLDPAIGTAAGSAGASVESEQAVRSDAVSTESSSTDPTSSSPGAGLATTGADTSTHLAGAVALLALGVVLAAVGRTADRRTGRR